MTLTVDGQRQPRPEPLQPLTLRDLIPVGVAHEAPLELWFEANSRIETVRADLGETNGWGG